MDLPIACLVEFGIVSTLGQAKTVAGHRYRQQLVDSSGNNALQHRLLALAPYFDLQAPWPKDLRDFRISNAVPPRAILNMDWPGIIMVKLRT